MLQIPSDFESIVQLRAHMVEIREMYWYSTLFSFQWWFSIFVPLCFIGIWIKFVKRSIIAETMLYGLLWATTSTLLDSVGTSFLLWEYPYTIVPMASKNLSANLTSIPIVFMLGYQYSSKIKTFIWATIAIAFFFSFVVEPLIVWLGIYKLYHWTYYYSFFIYVILSFVFRWLTKRIFAIQSRHCKYPIG
jgi:hypothetical protein